MKHYKVYQVEVGVLLDKDDPEYECYSQVWDHSNGFFDEDNMVCKTIKEAKEFLNYYIKNGVTHTYGIISELDINEEEYKVMKEQIEELCYEMDYDVKCVIYSAYKNDKDEIIENFVDNTYSIEKSNDEIEESEVL